MTWRVRALMLLRLSSSSLTWCGAPAGTRTRNLLIKSEFQSVVHCRAGRSSLEIFSKHVFRVGLVYLSCSGVGFLAGVDPSKRDTTNYVVLS